MIFNLVITIGFLIIFGGAFISMCQALFNGDDIGAQMRADLGEEEYKKTNHYKYKGKFKDEEDWYYHYHNNARRKKIYKVKI